MTCEFGRYVNLTAEEARILAETAVGAKHGRRTLLSPEAMDLLESMTYQMIWDDLAEELQK